MTQVNTYYESGSAAANRKRKAAKRLLYPRINQWLIQAAESNNLNSLLKVVTENLPDMNLVNLATSLHRVAKLAGAMFGDRAPVWASSQPLLFDSIPTALAAAFERTDVGANASRHQSIGNTLWALGVLHCDHFPVLRALADIVKTHISTLKLYEIATAIWSFGRLADYSEAIQALAAELMDAALPQVLSCEGQLSLNLALMVYEGTAAASCCASSHLNTLAAHRLCLSLDKDETTLEQFLDLTSLISCSRFTPQTLLTSVLGQTLRHASEMSSATLIDLIVTLASRGIFSTQLATWFCSSANSGHIEASCFAKVVCAYFRCQPELLLSSPPSDLLKARSLLLSTFAALTNEFSLEDPNFFSSDCFNLFERALDNALAACPLTTEGVARGLPPSPLNGLCDNHAPDHLSATRDVSGSGLFLAACPTSSSSLSSSSSSSSASPLKKDEQQTPTSSAELSNIEIEGCCRKAGGEWYDMGCAEDTSSGYADSDAEAVAVISKLSGSGASLRRFVIKNGFVDEVYDADDNTTSLFIRTQASFSNYSSEELQDFRARYRCVRQWYLANKRRQSI